MSNQYPKEEFSLEMLRRPARRTEVGGGWHNPSDILVSKLVFPGFEDRGISQSFRLQAATIFQNTHLEDDAASSTVLQTTLKGIGSPEDLPQKQDATMMEQAFDVVVESAGAAGSIPGLFRSLKRRWMKVEQSASIKVGLRKHEQPLGTVSLHTRVLPHPYYLKRNGFQSTAFLFPHQSSGVLYVDLEARFTAEHIKRILTNARRVSAKYDHSPRLVIRIETDESNLKNAGRQPAATTFWAYKSTNDVRLQTGSTAVMVQPVRYNVDPDDE